MQARRSRTRGAAPRDALRPFPDRRAAGVVLAEAIGKREWQPPAVVLGLPRGGVPVAYEVSRALQLPLDVLIVRKIGLPGQPELAIGAIASGGITVRAAQDIFPPAGFPRIDDRAFEAIAGRERLELARREHAYRGNAPPLELHGKTAILVDDGLATGSSMLAAVRAARHAGAAAVLAAAPVGSTEAAALLDCEADEVVIPKIPRCLRAIGEWYEQFSQVTDKEVREILDGRKRGPSDHGE